MSFLWEVLRRLTGYEPRSKALQTMVESLFSTISQHPLVADPADQEEFRANLQVLQARLRADLRSTNIHVVSALLGKALQDYSKQATLTAGQREQEFKRVIVLLAERAARLEPAHKQFYFELRDRAQSLQNLTQLPELGFLRRKLAEMAPAGQVTAQQEPVSPHQLNRLELELEQAYQRIMLLSQAAENDSLTRLPARGVAERRIRELVDKAHSFAVAIVVLENQEALIDRYGAACGDDIVRKVAQQLHEKLPQRVFLSRWGGPAFVGLAERLTAAVMRTILQKILTDIAAEPLEVDNQGSRLIQFSSKFAVHQWEPGQSSEKVVGIIDFFCASAAQEKSEGQESARPSIAQAIA